MHLLGQFRAAEAFREKIKNVGSEEALWCQWKTVGRSSLCVAFRTSKRRINNLEDNLHQKSPSTAAIHKQACLRKMVPGLTYTENSLADA